MNEMAALVKQLPSGFGYAWSGLSYQEQQSGSQAPLLYAVSLLFVFLCLAALYESWSIPFSVMLAVPIGIRSEEHTSELQSLMRISYAVFCLKKKKNKQLNATQYHIRKDTYTS